MRQLMRRLTAVGAALPVLLVGAVAAGGAAASSDPLVPTTGLIADYSFAQQPGDGITIDNAATGAGAVGDAVVQNPAGATWADAAVVLPGGAKTSAAPWVRLPAGILTGKAAATVT